MNVMARAMSSLAIVVAVLSACGQASPSPVPRASVTSGLAKPGSSETVQPSAAASTAEAVAQPPGLIAFDRFDSTFGAEAPYLGTAIINSDGSGERSFRVPAEVEGLNPIWAADGSRLLLLMWEPPAGPAHPGIIDADGSGLVRLDPAPTEGDVGCVDWSSEGSSSHAG
jgi:hypothetical protein